MISSSALQGQGDSGSFEQIRRPGYAMLIINTNPKGDNGRFEFTVRDGANEDSANLQTVFLDKFGFKWINGDCHQDVTTQQWDHRKGQLPENFDEANCTCLRCRIKNEDHTNSKCFVLAISSHGREITETEIIFSDGNSILLTEIFEALNDENCPTMANKPRIIILQVCRTIFKDQKKVMEMQDKGVTVLVHSTLSENSEQAHSSSRDDMPTSRFTVETVEDHSLQQIALAKMPNQYFLLYPVVAGQKAKRKSDDGSWLINGMKKIVLEKYSSNAKPVNFLRFITEVSGYVAREMESITYKEKNDNNAEGGTEDDQTSKNESTNTIAQNKREKKTKTDYVKDEQNSGFKNAVCSYHKLTSPIIFYPSAVQPQIPSLTLIDKVESQEHERVGTNSKNQLLTNESLPSSLPT